MPSQPTLHSGYLKALRARIGPRQVILAYATALIRDEHGRILFQRRPDFEWWGLPGGLLELDESLAGCCVREAREETGLEVRPTRLVGLYSGPHYAVRYPNGDEVQQWTVALECQIVGGALQADGAESTALKFFAPEAFPPTALWYEHMLRDWQAGRPAAFFEPPRPSPPDMHGAYVMELRRAVGAMPLIVAGSAAIIRNEAGHVLLIRRTDNGQWNLPAGAMDIGESAAETVVREVREETGLQVEPTRLLGAYSGPTYRFIYPHGDEVQIVSTIFECQPVGGALQPDGVEVSETTYFPLDALPSPMPPRIHQRLQEAAQNRPEAFFS